MLLGILLLLEVIAENTCGWLVRVPSGCTEPDFPSDLWMEVECGATLRPHGRDGHICDDGHEFGNLQDRYAPFGQAWQDEQDDMAAGF